MVKQKKITLSSDITLIPGVGGTRKEHLGKLGIFTVKDLLYHFPRAYENRADIRELGTMETDVPHSYILTVATSVTNFQVKRGLTYSKFRAFDDSGSCEVIFFNSPFVKEIFTVGSTFRFYGKTGFSKARRLTLTNPAYEIYTETTPLPDYVPIYHLTEGINSKFISKLVKYALDEVLTSIIDPLPEKIRLENNLATLTYAIKNMHSPDDANALAIAKRRLAYDEMLMFALSISKSAIKRTTTEGVSFSPCSLKAFTERLPYELTQSQKNVINDIYKDTVLTKTNGYTPSMARIIAGDVGSGKTVCAAAAAYIAHKSNYQTAFMAPTEILASQHYSDFKKLFDPLGIKTELLTGSTKKSLKNDICNRLSKGEIDIIIGTHALLSDSIDFSALGLIITDEQHRFGVRQRAVLKNKTSSAHMLVMSATPIPRTMALAMYGDLDLSRITEMPKGRIRVDTYVVDEGYRNRLNDFIKKQVTLGGQCYIVCPSIEKNEESNEYLTYGISNQEIIEARSLDLKNAVEYTEELRKSLPSIKVECLHGKMKNSEKDEIMGRFSRGETDVLVSTTVIEVGVNVPNASLMIVENAERFGLSQLHQLRGRVGRGTRKSYCILVSNSNTEKAMARLDVIRTTYDGYEIAEKDLLLRGPGDFFSGNSGDNLRQSGGFEFKIANQCDDPNLFEQAFINAKSIIESDPDLEFPEHAIIKENLSHILTNISDIS